MCPLTLTPTHHPGQCVLSCSVLFCPVLLQVTSLTTRRCSCTPTCRAHQARGHGGELPPHTCTAQHSTAQPLHNSTAQHSIPVHCWLACFPVSVFYSTSFYSCTARLCLTTTETDNTHNTHTASLSALRCSACARHKQDPSPGAGHHRGLLQRWSRGPGGQ